MKSATDIHMAAQTTDSVPQRVFDPPPSRLIFQPLLLNSGDVVRDGLRNFFWSQCPAINNNIDNNIVHGVSRAQEQLFIYSFSVKIGC